MGFWNKLFGGADGCREAMRESYEKHVRLAKEGRIPGGDSPHFSGLYGALGTRYVVRGVKIGEVVLFAELAPFMTMQEREAVEALAEYAVFQERPKDARVTWLTEMLNSALRTSTDDLYTASAAGGVINQVAWYALLTPDTIGVIQRAVDRFSQKNQSE